MSADRFLDQHREIRVLIKGLHECLSPTALSEDPQPAFHQIRRLGGFLRQHFQDERVGLYGRLLGSRDAHVAALAHCAELELCSLEPQVMDYVRTWLAAGRIRGNPEGFVRASRAIIAAVGKRIGDEERQLMPLLKRAG